MRNANRGLAVLFASLLVGCGHLAVDVAVLDPDVVESEMERYLHRDLLPNLLAQTEASIEDQVTEIKAEHKAFYEKTAEQYRQTALQLSEEKQNAIEFIAASLVDDFGLAWDERYKGWKEELVVLANRARELNREIDAPDEASTHVSDREKAVEAGKRLRGVLRQYYGKLAEIQRAIRIDTNDKFDNVVSQLEDYEVEHALIAIAQSELEESTEESENLVSKSFGLDTKPIHGSPHAHAVASAPEEFWAKPFNQAYGRGYFGNVDVAIALDSQTGNYTVKGVLFDPSDVANAISKVTTQALVLAAQVYGVPVPPGSGDSNVADGTALTNSSKQLTDLEASTAAKVAAKEDLESALDAIAASIVEKRKRLTGDDADARTEAIEAIKATFDAYKSQLEQAEE